ncbi:hypothetical protein WMF38_12880 [Sorangium sp. So ce118]
MLDKLTPQIIRTLLLKYLKEHHDGQFRGAVDGVVRLAVSKGLVGNDQNSQRAADHVASTRVRELLWQLLVQGILAFGSRNGGNEAWPFYALTEYGIDVVSKGAPQPYDAYSGPT